MKLEIVEQALNSCLNGSTPSASKQEILDQMSDLLIVLTQFQDKWDIIRYGRRLVCLKQLVIFAENNTPQLKS